MSLRARLLLGVLLLVATGVLAADVVTYRSLQSFLVQRVDDSLDADHRQFERSLPKNPSAQDLELAAATAGDTFVEVRSESGDVLTRHAPRTGDDRDTPDDDDERESPAPEFPLELQLGSNDSAEAQEQVKRFDVDAVSGDGRYRVRATREPGSSITSLLAVPLDNVHETAERLRFIELVVAGVTLLGIALLGLWVIRVALRPLRSFSETAKEIAAGDLSRRVTWDDEGTEIGQLGRAFNSMLAQIERSFHDVERSEGRLRRFAGDASHELRTPLSAIRAYAELFARGAQGNPDDLERSMLGIQRESERMSRLIEDLLTLVKIDEESLHATEPVDLLEVAHESAETAHAIDATHAVAVEGSSLIVSGDHHQLRQVLDNLLANVRVHTPAGTPAVIRVATDGNDALLQVTDEGDGVASEAAGEMFQRFYRVDSSRARSTGGSGLGLAIVAAIAEAHGGSVSASAAASGGLCITIRLPQRPIEHP